MTRIRYGARSPEQLRNRELETTSVETWATTLTAIYETDADAIAAVLPQPLIPSATPIVRVAIATVDVGRGYPVFGAGTFAVQAMHRDMLGYYPLVMPMTTEQAVIGGRETFGEPKKLANVTLHRDGDAVSGSFSRLGVTFVEISGRIVREIPPFPDERRSDFYFKFLLDPSGKGFDSDPWLVYCHRDERTRSLAVVEGTITLGESRFDPVADLPVRKVLSIEFAERASSQRGELIQTVPGEWIRPFVHQRYDDLSVLGSD